MNKSFLLLLCFIAPYIVAMDTPEKEGGSPVWHPLRVLAAYASRLIRRDIHHRVEQISSKEEDLSDDCGVVLQHLRSVWARHGWSWTEEVESDGTIIFRSEDSVIRIDPKTVQQTFFSRFEVPETDIDLQYDSMGES